jgi:hypothetical protein
VSSQPGGPPPSRVAVRHSNAPDRKLGGGVSKTNARFSVRPRSARRAQVWWRPISSLHFASDPIDHAVADRRLLLQCFHHRREKRVAGSRRERPGQPVQDALSPCPALLRKRPNCCVAAIRLFVPLADICSAIERVGSALQLPSEFVEEAPVGALRDDLARS